MIGLAFAGLLAALMTFALLRGAQLPPTVDLLRPAQVPGRTSRLWRQLVRGALSLYPRLALPLLVLVVFSLSPVSVRLGFRWEALLLLLLLWTGFDVMCGVPLLPTVDLLRPAQVPGRTSPLWHQRVRGALSLNQGQVLGLLWLGFWLVRCWDVKWYAPIMLWLGGIQMSGVSLLPTVDLLRPVQVPGGRTSPSSRHLVRGALSLYLRLAPALLPLGALALLPSWGARLDAQLPPLAALLPLGTLAGSLQAHLLGMGWLHAGLRGLIWALGPVLCTRLLLLAAAAPVTTTARPWRQSPRLAATLRGLHGPHLWALVRFVGLFTLLNLCPLLLGALWARANPNEAMTGLTRSLPLFGLQLYLFLLSSLAGPLLAQQPQPLGRLLRVCIARSLAQPYRLAGLVYLPLYCDLSLHFLLDDLSRLQMGQSALLTAASLLLQALLLPFVWLYTALWVRHRL